MAGELSDREDSVGHEAELVDAAAPVARSDTGLRGQGAADPAYPGLAQCRQRAQIDMLARFQFGKTSDLQSPEDVLPPQKIV